MTRECRHNSSLIFIVTATVILILATAFAGRAHVMSTGQQRLNSPPVPVLFESQQLMFLPAVFYNTEGSTTAVADLNGDGSPDLLGINPDGNASVRLGNGEGTFAPPITSPLGRGPRWLVVADVNLDHKLDLLVVSPFPGCSGYNGSCIGVSLGNGDGTFRSAIWLATRGYDAGAPAVADVNGDGKPDLLVANAHDADPANSSLMVFLGNGNGDFQLAGGYPYGGVAYSFPAANVMTADLNGDNNLDVFVISCNPGNTRSCSTQKGLASALLGNGDGAFQAAHSYVVGNTLFDTPPAVIADVNRDSRPDLIVANLGASNPDGEGSAEVLLGNGDGTFQPATTYYSGAPEASSIAIADLNGDGLPDLVLAHNAPFDNGTVGILLGKGDGTFDPPHLYAAPGGSVPALGVTITDLNGDRRPDIVVASECLNGCAAGSVNVLLGNGDGTFQAAQTYFSVGHSVYGLAVADTNGDRKPDLLVTSGSNMGVLLNNGGAPPTKLTLVSSAEVVPVLQPVTYTATLSPQTGNAGPGAITFLDGFDVLGILPPDASPIAIRVSHHTMGTHQVKAVYSGELNTALGSVSSLNEKVLGISSTAITASQSSSLLAEPVTFIAKVRSKYGWIPDGGLVTFFDGATPLASVALRGQQVSYATSSLPAGTHVIKATYPGNADFIGSFAVVKQFVIGHSTSTTLASNLNPSVYGQKVTWAATVTSSATPAPTGNIVFNGKDMYGRTFVIGRATLDSSGVATLIKSNLNANVYQVTAVYLGDTMNLGSMSSVLNQVVRQTTSKAVLNSSRSPATQGQLVTFTATITSPTVMPTGPVTFTAGKQVLGTAQIVPWEHKATLAISSLPVGSTVVTVTFPGNSNIAKSSASLTQTVQ